MTNTNTHGAHSHSANHREEIEKSEKCGCFYCKKIYAPSKIKEWIDGNENGTTAICPYCGIDSVIGNASGYVISSEFLTMMHRAWF